MVPLRISDAHTPPSLRVSVDSKLCFTPVITIKLFTAKKKQKNNNNNTFPMYLRAHIKLPYHYEWTASSSRTCVRCRLRLNRVKGAEPLCCFSSECLWEITETFTNWKKNKKTDRFSVNHKTTLSDGSVVFHTCWTQAPPPQTINCRRRHIFNIPLTCQHILTVHVPYRWLWDHREEEEEEEEEEKSENVLKTQLTSGLSYLEFIGLFFFSVWGIWFIAG